MFETITKHVRENSVVRFLLSHLIILLGGAADLCGGIPQRVRHCAQ